MTKAERLMMLELKNTYDKLIKAYEVEVSAMQNALNDLKEARKILNASLRNKETIDRRLEELCNCKKAGEEK